MKPSKTIVLSVATALGIGFAGASVAGTQYPRADSRAAQPLGMSTAAMETHFGAHPGELSYFNDFSAAAATTVSQADSAPSLATQPAQGEDLQPASTSSLQPAPAVTVVEPALLYSDGTWYSYNAGDWYALEGGEWHTVDAGTAAIAEGTGGEGASWYHVTEIPVQIVVHSADGTETYILQGEELLVFTPVAVENDGSASIASAESRYMFF